MSSNLFKAGWVVLNDDTRVINTNDLVEQRVREAAARAAALQPANEEEEENWSEGLEADHVDDLLNQDSETAVLKSASIEANTKAEQALKEAEERLEQASRQAERMLEEAREEIEAMKVQEMQEAHSQGYEAGYKEGMAQTQELKNEYQAKEKELKLEYQQAIQKLEPTFIETLTGIYEHIFKVDLSGYKSLVTELLIDTMTKSERAKNYIIHVSKEDFPDVTENKERILEETGTMGENLEIIADMTLSEAQCMIETEGGIYDCSLGTELEELKKKLVLLAYKQ